MTRDPNLVMAQPPQYDGFFDDLGRLEPTLEAAGFGPLQFERDRTIDESSARYEFLLPAAGLQLWVHDDFELDLRYVCVRGDPGRRSHLMNLLSDGLHALSPDDLVDRATRLAESEPRWLVALALGSPSPAPAEVVQVIERHLASAHDTVVTSALRAAFTIGRAQFEAALRALRSSGRPAVVALLSELDALFR